MLDDGAALCLTPQAFSNVVAAADVFNNANLQFWEYGASRSGRLRVAPRLCVCCVCAATVC